MWLFEYEIWQQKPKQEQKQKQESNGSQNPHTAVLLP